MRSRAWIWPHPELDEKWVQDLIAKDPSILGLGDLELRQKERRGRDVSICYFGMLKTVDMR